MSENTQPDEWMLTPQQMAYMYARREAIALAYETNDMELLRRYEASQAYTDVFGDMTWDEAYDRYEETPEWLIFVSEDTPVRSKEAVEWAHRRLKELGII